MAGPYFWVGGTGNWSDATNHWSTTSGGLPNAANVPTSSDNVSFDILSNTTAYTVTVDVTANCKDMTWALPSVSGVPTLAGSAFNLSVFGSVSFITGMSVSLSTTLLMAATTTGKTVTTNGVQLGCFVNFSGSGGGWTLQDDLTLSGSNKTLTVSNGILNTNAKTVTVGTFVSTSGTRTLTLDNSTINITGTSGTPWNISTTGTLTFSWTNGTLNYSGGTVNTQTNLNLASQTYNTINITAAGTVVPAMSTTSVKNFSYTSTTDKRDNLQFNTLWTLAASGSLTFAGNSVVNRAFVSSNGLGTQRTITIPNTATVTLTNVDFQDIASAGTFGTWTGTSLGDCLGNSGITFDGSTTQTYAGGTNNWSTAAAWTSRVPLPQDDVVVNTTTAGTLTADMPRLGRNIDFTSFTRTVSLSSVANTVFGNLALSTGMTWTQSVNLIFQGRGSQTITSTTKTFSGTQIQAFGGTYTLQDAYTNSGSVTVANGTFASGSFDISAGSFAFSGAATKAISGSGVWSITGTSGPIWSANNTGTTVTAFTGTIKFTGNVTTNVTFAGAGLVYPNFWWSSTTATGTLIITGANTFNDVKWNRTTTRTIQWPSATTNTITSWTDESLGTAVLTLTASTGGSAAILTKASGFVSTDYLAISDSNAPASPDASIWFAGANSTSVSGANTRWRFASIQTILGGGQLLLRGVGG